ncbi:MAG: hypothetical protein KGS61_16125, partial [Verrucomicrobia bacterium]|nr:hypothetical protein [Verrucomicrobiota bacterium]
SMYDPVTARRRWFGTLFLALAAGLLIWGQTWLKPYLRGVVFLGYWLACFVFTGLAMLIALLDLRAMRRQTRQQQRDLIERTLLEIEAERTGRTDRDQATTGEAK